MTKVIIVSPAEIHAYFTDSYPDWDTQVPVETIDDMWAGLQNGALSTETSLVIFSDAYLNDYADDLATAIATFAPEALVLILFYDMDNQTRLRALVTEKANQLGLNPANYYPVNTMGDLGKDIYDAFVQYETDLKTPQPAVQPEAQPTQVQPQTAVETSQAPARNPHSQASNESNPDGSRGLIIASTSSKGGSGKTTVAICTAAMLYHSSRIAAEQGKREKPLRICIVDMDTRDGQIGFLLGQSTPTALNIFVAKDRTPETIAENLIYDERLGVWAILAPKRARTADYLTPEFYQDLIQKLSYMFDVVLLDTSVNYLDPLLGQVVLPIADAVMFVTNLSIGSVYGMNRWMDEVTSPVDAGGSGINKEKIGIVVNQSAPDLGIDQELLKHASAGVPLLVAIPLDSAAVISASNHNRLSDIILGHQDISPAYYSIARQLLPNANLVSPLQAITNEAPTGGAKRPNSGPAPIQKQKRRGIFK